MKKAATAVLLYPQFSEYELSVALSIFMQGGKPVVTAGIEGGAVRGEGGLNCIPDVTIDNLDHEEIDSLILPGCMDIMKAAGDERLIHFLKEIESRMTVIAAISSSPLLLAQAGLLKGKKYTVGLNEQARDASGVFEKENYSNELVIVDGKIITARGRGFIEFGTVVGDALGLSFDDGWYKG
ncbi:DJ-1/PfpI family protein [Rossellomorea aquimaris]|uniref:4-methyl-5(B-hydroxyethyl)-thiazole monophosphate biosynthesis protein n=1 Tax=Rossellomorea aquimaris TaxID=189382 RepID=A0A1J6WEY2_9BACI|nr:DJ-1/PfpI family protein [Rossellomorea aquimaris]OIU70440.1 4-methyl-5(B-hydroxyethyl)-thiazole monophosphate biosynthesis protein [Rossellomorea aquimaris]